MKDLIIFGAGGLAREVGCLVLAINEVEGAWSLLGYVDCDSGSVGYEVGRYRVICTEDEALAMDVAAVIAIGNPVAIRRVAEKVRSSALLVFPNLVHPCTVLDRERVAFGGGNIVCAGNILTTDIRVGWFNVLNLACTFGHDVVIGDYCVVNPGARISGGVSIGDGCLIGTGATILQGVRVGAGSTVGAGAVVTKDVSEGQTVVGIPAKPIRG